MVITVGLFPEASRADDVDDSEEQLVRDIEWLEKESHKRSSHVATPTPGSFGELALPHLAELEKLHQQWASDGEGAATIRREIAHGSRGVADLSVHDRLALERFRAAVNGVLAASHAESARMPPRFDLFSFFGPQGGGSFLSFQATARFAAFEAWIALDEQRAGRALALCRDTLAMARDVSRAFMIGQLVSAAIVRTIEPACTTAVGRVSPAEARAFTASLVSIQREWALAAHTFRIESIFGQIVLFTSTLGQPTRQVVETKGKEILAEAESRTGFARFRLALFGGYARRKYVRSMHRLMQATVLPPAESDREIAKMPDDVSFASTLLGRDLQENWLDFARRMRDTQARVWLLIAVGNQRAACDGRGDVSGAAAAHDARSGRPFEIDRTPSSITARTVFESERTSEVLTAVVPACAR